MNIRKLAKRALAFLGLSKAPLEFELRRRFPQYEIGEGSYGGLELFAFAGTDRVRIGKYTSIAKNVRVLLGGEHRTDWVTTYPFPEVSPEHAEIEGHPASKGPVVIGNDVWIGIGAMVLSGIHIGDGAVVSAGAVVTKNVPPYAIVGGNPAKLIRSRFLPEQIEALLRIKWWEWPVEKIRSEIPALCSANIDEFILRHDC